jgi:hypothetical protein
VHGEPLRAHTTDAPPPHTGALSEARASGETQPRRAAAEGESARWGRRGRALASLPNPNKRVVHTAENAGYKWGPLQQVRLGIEE